MSHGADHGRAKLADRSRQAGPPTSGRTTRPTARAIPPNSGGTLEGLGSHGAAAGTTSGSDPKGVDPPAPKAAESHVAADKTRTGPETGARTISSLALLQLPPRTRPGQPASLRKIRVPAPTCLEKTIGLGNGRRSCSRQ